MEIRSAFYHPTFNTKQENTSPGLPSKGIFSSNPSNRKNALAPFEGISNSAEAPTTTVLKSNKPNDTNLAAIYSRTLKTRPFTPLDNQSVGFSKSRLAIATYRDINQQANEPERMLVLNRIDTFA